MAKNADAHGRPVAKGTQANSSTADPPPPPPRPQAPTVKQLLFGKGK